MILNLELKKKSKTGNRACVIAKRKRQEREYDREHSRICSYIDSHPEMQMTASEFYSFTSFTYGHATTLLRNLIKEKKLYEITGTPPTVLGKKINEGCIFAPKKKLRSYRKPDITKIGFLLADPTSSPDF